VCGLKTEEIARAFLVTPATLAQRIVRAKAVIRDKTIPYQVPSPQELPARLGAVLQVVYLVFNEGYSAESTGAELSCEAIRLGRVLRALLPEPEVTGLLGLMLLQESRRAALIDRLATDLAAVRPVAPYSAISGGETQPGRCHRDERAPGAGSSSGR
jgi:RNA polymerase sigma-70 factor (ECF subfamily)